MTSYDPLKLEPEVLKFWEKEKIYDKVNELRSKGPRFSFYDGPPTANNPMGVHHSWGRTYKDMMCRFKSMQGFNVRRQPGFDCQGLWVEVEVEKALGFKGKKDIEKYGIGEFSHRCRERVLKFVDVWIDLSKKLGMWMDWDNPYLTMSDENIEHVWHFLKACHEKGWLFEGEKSLPWCPRCGTSLSSHEVGMGYAELTHDAVYLKFPIKGRKNEFLLVWTTTPWTLTADTATAVNPESTYVKVKQGDDVLYLSKNLTKALEGDYVVLEEMNGERLLGLKFEAPYKDLPFQKGVVHAVVAWKDVSEEEGTGIVHIAPGCGPEDYELGKEFNLSVISPIDQDGKFIKGAGWLENKTAKEANELILKDLKDRGYVYKVEKYTHRYPCCWRCKEELVFRTEKEWFLGSKEVKPKLMGQAERVFWFPKFSGKRMQDWLTTMQDWCISRKRYWGLPLPFWKCECGHLEVIGSREELKEKAKAGLKGLKELHRPWIDDVILECPKCGKDMRRIPEVGDCWLDAGIIPFSTLNYLSDRAHWKKWYPAHFITEMHEQVNLWFYSMLFMGVTITGKTPYKSALTHGSVCDETGKEMHKSWGNMILADEGLKKMGADIMRWMYASQNPKYPILFGYTPAREVRKVLNVLFNTGRYVKTYCKLNNFKPKKVGKLDLASKWILSRLQSLKKEVTKDIEKLNPHLAARKLQDFFLNDFSRWYVHLIRDKVKRDYRGKEKEGILSTLYKTMLEILQLMSPFTPFLTEFLYRDFFNKFEKRESVHMMDWPKVEKKYVDKELERKMEVIRKIVEASNSARQATNLRLRWPVKRVIVVTEDKGVKRAVESLKDVLLGACNAKSVEMVTKRPKGEFAESDMVIAKILVDLTEDEDLAMERLYRELTRRIQNLRKKRNYVVSDRIELSLKSDPKVEEGLRKFLDAMKKDVGAKRITVGKLKGKHKGELKFKNVKIQIAFE